MEGKTFVESDDVVEKYRLKHFVKHDRGDYYEFEPDGVMINKEGLIWVCGADHVEEFERIHEEKVINEAVAEFCAGVKKRYEDEPQGLDDNSNSMVRGGTADAEAHNMDTDPLTNNLDMKELDSALHNCAKGNCAACGGIYIYIYIYIKL
ncbi:hypothetical protein C2S51_003338 [Perilla frutescens var. frutescens]|nr:hypothetical protein C2S51_003338 [Perilla frutescens var. frutescens]